MPLRDGYGVLIGTLHNYFCDRKTDGRNYYHCNIRVRSLGKFYLCPVDLDSKHHADGLQWRVVHMPGDALGPVMQLSEGWHDLESLNGSGAIDYYLSDALMPTGECRESGEVSNSRLCPPWKHGSGIEAFADLEKMLAGGRKLFVFGEQFRVGRGVHNIHQNQGDPPSSRWHAENGAWQDGAVAVLNKDGTVSVFLCKFKTQKFFPAVPREVP
jgi:hypothetical protein